MFEYFERLRKQPEADKRKAVLRISLSITLAIAVVWGVMTYMRVSATDLSFPADQAAKDMPGFKEIFAGFLDNAGKLFGGQ
ncbi:MAG TPA: hypothetical protein VHD69_02055 [Candidatus Paceibacterota bacterium]|nr:hypothetical protein [Candidatus Paceibacterota bacterium]